MVDIEPDVQNILRELEQKLDAIERDQKEYREWLTSASNQQLQKQRIEQVSTMDIIKPADSTVEIQTGRSPSESPISERVRKRKQLAANSKFFKKIRSKPIHSIESSDSDHSSSQASSDTLQEENQIDVHHRDSSQNLQPSLEAADLPGAELPVQLSVQLSVQLPVQLPVQLFVGAECTSSSESQFEADAGLVRQDVPANPNFYLRPTTWTDLKCSSRVRETVHRSTGRIKPHRRALFTVVQQTVPSESVPTRIVSRAAARKVLGHHRADRQAADREAIDRPAAVVRKVPARRVGVLERPVRREVFVRKKKKGKPPPRSDRLPAGVVQAVTIPIVDYVARPKRLFSGHRCEKQPAKQPAKSFISC